MADADNVIPLRRRRRRALPNRAALQFLREAGGASGVVEVASYADLAAILGWEKSRAWKAIQAWKRDGRALVDFNADDDKISIRIPPDRRVLERGKGRGISTERKRERRWGKNPAASVEGVTNSIDMPDTYDDTKTAETRFATDGEAVQSPSPATTPSTAAPAATPSTTLPRFASHQVKPPDWRHGGGGGRDGVMVAPARDGELRIGKWTLCAALVMAAFSTVLTVMGFAILLPGWMLLSMGLGAAMEFGRLVVVGTATRRWRELSGVLRAGALVYILLAESVSLIGVYSELHNLHTGDRPAATAAAEQGRVAANAQVDYQRGVIADLDKQIDTWDRNSGALVTADAKRGRVNAGRDLMASQSRQRDQIVAQRRQAAATLASMQTEAARATGRGAVLETEVGSVRQVAALLHIDAGEALRYWLLAITLLIGPCASLLIAMAMSGSGRHREAR